MRIKTLDDLRKIRVPIPYGIDPDSTKYKNYMNKSRGEMENDQTKNRN